MSCSGTIYQIVDRITHAVVDQAQDYRNADFLIKQKTAKIDQELFDRFGVTPPEDAQPLFLIRETSLVLP